MLRFLIYLNRAEERRRFIRGMREAFAHSSVSDLECAEAATPAAALARVQASQPRLLCWDVRDPDSLAVLEQVRKEVPQAFLLVVADNSTSPLTFLRPAISPDSLVLSPPLQDSEIYRTVNEMLAAVRSDAESQEAFTIIAREEHLHIPYSRIYCFEARERRLYACLRSEEIGFNGTLEQLEKQLPANFQRVHRAFIVNTAKIERVLMTENLIRLQGGFDIPVSRSYKKIFREKTHG